MYTDEYTGYEIAKSIKVSYWSWVPLRESHLLSFEITTCANFLIIQMPEHIDLFVTIAKLWCLSEMIVSCAQKHHKLKICISITLLY